MPPKPVKQRDYAIGAVCHIRVIIYTIESFYGINKQMSESVVMNQIVTAYVH